MISINLKRSKFLLWCKVLFKTIETIRYLKSYLNVSWTIEKYDFSATQYSTNFYILSSVALPGLNNEKRLSKRNYSFWE